MEPPPASQGSEEQHLLRAVQLAQIARDLGEAPFGVSLVNREGAIFMEAHNTVLSTRDISAHPEFKIAQWVARKMSRSAATETSMFASCQPCAMRNDAIDRSDIGRVIYALSGEQLNQLRGTAGYAKVRQHGPYVPELAAKPVRGYCNSKRCWVACGPGEAVVRIGSASQLGTFGRGPTMSISRPKTNDGCPERLLFRRAAICCLLMPLFSVEISAA